MSDPTSVIATSSSTTYRCLYGETQKLNETNYHQWSTDVEIFLRSENAFKIVRRTENRPNGASAAQVLAAERYDTRLAKAYALIASSCSQNVRTYIVGLEHPADVWDALKEKLDTARSQAGKIARSSQLHQPPP